MFEPVRSLILSSVELPSFVETYSRVVRASSHDSSHHVSQPIDSCALAAHTSPNRLSQPTNRRGFCEGHSNHEDCGARGPTHHCGMKIIPYTCVGIWL